MSDVDDGGDAGNQSAKDVSQSNPPRDRNTRIPCAGSVRSNGIPGPADGRTVQKNQIGYEYEKEYRNLRWKDSPQVALSKRQKRSWEVRVVHGGARHTLSNSTE